MLKPRPIVVTVHYNRHKAPQGLPWTVHTSRACTPASRVIWNVPNETIFKPEKRSNPKGWIRAKGLLRWEGSIAIIEAP